MALPIGPRFSPMNTSLVDTLPVSRRWQYEPKWDGLRCLALKDGTTVKLQSKMGEPLHCYFPELADALREIATRSFVLDGQIVIPGLNFDGLLQRVQTTGSSVQSLARNYRKKLVVFDLLVFCDWKLFSSQTLAERRRALEIFFAQYLSQNPILQLSPATRQIDIARRWLQILGKEIDGIVAKRLDLRYQPGGRSGIRKVERRRAADCVVEEARSRG
jgi:ATP-dependent DNA ligase